MTFRKSLAVLAGGLVAAAFLAGCATTNISVQQALNAETLDRATYAWAGGGFAADAPDGVSRAQLNALRTALTDTLDARGYERVDDPALADLLVAVAVDLDFTEGRGTTDRDDVRNTDDDIGTVRVYEGRQQPTSTATRSQRSRAATMLRSVGEDAGLVGQIDTVFTISILEGVSLDQIWQGTIQKSLSAAELDGFAYEIDANVTELFRDFPVSAGGE